MTAVVEALLTKGTRVASRCLVLLMAMFSDVMSLEVVFFVKASVAHVTQKVARLTMNGLWMPLQRILAKKVLGTNLAHGRLSLFLERRRGRRRRRRRRQVNSRTSNTAGWCVFRCLCSTSFLSVDGILDMKNRPIVDERILDVFSYFLE